MKNKESQKGKKVLVFQNGKSTIYSSISEVARIYNRSLTMVKRALAEGTEIRPGVTVDEAC